MRKQYVGVLGKTLDVEQTRDVFDVGSSVRAFNSLVDRDGTKLAQFSLSLNRQAVTMEKLDEIIDYSKRVIERCIPHIDTLGAKPNDLARASYVNISTCEQIKAQTLEIEAFDLDKQITRNIIRSDQVEEWNKQNEEYIKRLREAKAHYEKSLQVLNEMAEILHHDSVFYTNKVKELQGEINKIDKRIEDANHVLPTVADVENVQNNTKSEGFFSRLRGTKKKKAKENVKEQDVERAI